MIGDILPFVLNTERPLSDIWLLRYKQNSFGCFREKSQFQFFPKTPKIALLITQQPNIAEAVLYSKQTAGYLLSPHIKTIDSRGFYVQKSTEKTWLLRKLKSVYLEIDLFLDF